MVFGGFFSITGIPFLLFCVFAVAFLGYVLGIVTVKGIKLGTAGVFVTALLFGCFFFEPLQNQMTNAGTTYVNNALKIVENLGLVLFVSSVGFMAGPTFFVSLKKNFKSYFALAAFLVLLGSLMCLLCIAVFGCDPSMAVGLLSGALTSTPGFSAAKETVQAMAENPEIGQQMEDMVTVGHGIAYLFGVVGKVLFVQLVPRIARADMAKEREKLGTVSPARKVDESDAWFRLDRHGFGTFALAAVLGIALGAVKIPMGKSQFSLGVTGGTLIAALVLGHFGHIGGLILQIPKYTLEVLRELGLMLFLIGAGIPGGAKFAQYFEPVYFLYGALMTVVPLIAGYFFATKLLKLSMLGSLGGITGGMTSTPALGMLISVSGTDSVASAYAAAYPVAVVCAVLVSQFLLLLF